MARELSAASTDVQIEQAVSKAVKSSTSGSTEEAAKAARTQAAKLKSLIVKTADEIYSEIDRITTSLSGVYVAKSEFGEYAETVQTTIEQTAKETVERYDFASQISAVNERVDGVSTYVTEIRGEIQRGIITDPETGEEQMGIAISERLNFTGETREESGYTYYKLSPGQTLGLYTSKGWQFWINGSKRGWFDSTDGMLHVANIVVEAKLQLGSDWIITTSGGFGIRHVG